MVIDLLLLFAFGSIFGYVLEVIRRSIGKGRIINPGFLTGPYLPIYGFGVVALYLVSSLKVNILWKILLFFVATTGIELIGGVFFLYHYRIKLWDYSKEKFNYKGIICLKNSIYWVFLSLVFYYAIFPVIEDVLSLFKANLGLMFALGLFYGFFLLDEIKSLMLAYRVRAFVKKQKKKIKISYLSFVKSFPGVRKFIPKDFVKQIKNM